MDKIIPANYLKARWRKYLEEKGHFIYKTARHNIIRSRNRTPTKYHWLFLTGQGRKRILNKADRLRIREYLNKIRKPDHSVYLVVGFVSEPDRIVIIPASRALANGYVSSEKGGIDWDG